MKKVYFLKTCSTCKRIMSEFDLTDFEQREIKSKAVSEEELQEMCFFLKFFAFYISGKYIDGNMHAAFASVNHFGFHFHNVTNFYR